MTGSYGNPRGSVAASSSTSRFALRRALKAAPARRVASLLRCLRAPSIAANSSGVSTTASSPGLGAPCRGFQLRMLSNESEN
jgi:hypothetical protein